MQMTNAVAGDAALSDPLEALTGALVESNDRLLGLIGLTERAVLSLDEDDLVEELITRAIAILDLDGIAVRRSADGPDTYQTWGVIPKLVTGSSLPWTRDQSLSNYGSLGVSAWREHPQLGTGDAKVLTAVTNLLASTVRIARMHTEAVEQALMASEHDTAARITTATLQDPGRPPSIDGMTLHAHLTPARTTGGDLWAWHQTAANDLWFAIGDVSGKGLPAAVMMATIVTATRDAFLRYGDDGPVAVVDAVSQQIYRGLSNAGMFSTFLVGCWSQSGLVKIANAGHSPAVALRDGVAQRIDATVPPIGVIDDMSPTIWQAQLNPGDAIVLASDGFTEQRDSDGAAFGEDEFDAAIEAAASGASAAADIGNTLVANLIDHTGTAEPDDDRTLLVLHVDNS